VGASTPRPGPSPAAASRPARPSKKQLDQAEVLATRVHGEVAQLHAALADPALYRGDPDRLRDLQQRLGEAERALVDAEAAWLDLQEQWERAAAG
jgi:hypothetical protein